MPIERKLAAIMFTDIAGYTEQMSKDEDKAFALIKKKRDLLLPILEKHEGKLIKEIGDGTLTRYFKADNAIDCASKFQSKTDTDLNVRAGIHTGEVIVDKEDVFGDVVNVASRLESIAVPGSVLVSKETIDKLEMSDEVELVSLGMQSLKGVGRLIEVYAIKDEGLVVPNPEDYTENKIEVHSDDEVPSIAIIPFENKGAEEDVFYAYGISADLISDCSSAGLIRVASLSDIEKLDYIHLDNKVLSEKLFTRYIAQGTLWKMGDMFQLSVELYDTNDKKVVWSDRWQETWDNLPTIKSTLSDGLLKALDTKPKIEQKVETTNPEAYEFYLKGKYNLEQFFKNANVEKIYLTRKFTEKSIELDDNFIPPLIVLGKSYFVEDRSKKGQNRDQLLNTAHNIFKKSLDLSLKLSDRLWEGRSLRNIGNILIVRDNDPQALDYYLNSLDIALEINDKDGQAHCYYNLSLFYIEKIIDLDKALAYQHKGIEIRKELDDKLFLSSDLNNAGDIYFKKGDYNQALQYYHEAFDIGKELQDFEGQCTSLNNIGTYYTCRGQYNRAIEYFNKAIYISEEIGSPYLHFGLNKIGSIYSLHLNEFQKALECFEKAISVCNKINYQSGVGWHTMDIGILYFINGDYLKSIEYLEKSFTIYKEVNNTLLLYELNLLSYLYLAYKRIGDKYDINKINNLVNKLNNFSLDINYILYELFEDKSYLETAFKQVEEQIEMIEPSKVSSFKKQAIPKSIIEEWEKLK